MWALQGRGVLFPEPGSHLTTCIEELKRAESQRSLTVTPSHASIVVRDSNEVVHVGAGLGVAHKLRHVQIPEKEKRL